MGHRLPLVLALAAVLASGCAAEAGGVDTEETVDDFSVLKHRTIVKATMTEAGTITVAYEPARYPPPSVLGGVPFLAIKLPPGVAEEIDGDDELSMDNLQTADTSTRSVRVEGNFPGAPQLTVTDENFRAIGRANGRKTLLGGEATLKTVPDRGRFVLVRDLLWVKPMTFRITVNR